MGWWSRFLGRDKARARVASPAVAPEEGGGWRQVRPLRGVIQRTAGGPGFRGVIAGQTTPLLIGGLGHRIDHGAPAGLARGLVRYPPAGPGSHGGGDDLVYRAPTVTAEAAEDAVPGGAVGEERSRPRPIGGPLTVARAVPPVRRLPPTDFSATAGRSGSSAAEGPTVQRRAATPAASEARNPGAAGSAGATRDTVEPRNPRVPRKPDTARNPGVPEYARAPQQPGVPEKPSASQQPGVPESPSVSQQAGGPRRQSAARIPGASAGPPPESGSGSGTAARRRPSPDLAPKAEPVADPASGAGAGPGQQGEPSGTPVVRRRTKGSSPLLGEPLNHLPSTVSVPAAPDGPPTPAAGQLPVVRTEAQASPVRVQRSMAHGKADPRPVPGIGEPIAEIPASALPLGKGSSGADSAALPGAGRAVRRHDDDPDPTTARVAPAESVRTPVVKVSRFRSGTGQSNHGRTAGREGPRPGLPGLPVVVTVTSTGARGNDRVAGEAAAASGGPARSPSLAEGPAVQRATRQPRPATTRQTGNTEETRSREAMPVVSPVQRPAQDQRDRRAVSLPDTMRAPGMRVLDTARQGTSTATTAEAAGHVAPLLPARPLALGLTPDASRRAQLGRPAVVAPRWRLSQPWHHEAERSARRQPGRTPVQRQGTAKARRRESGGGATGRVPVQRLTTTQASPETRDPGRAASPSGFTRRSPALPPVRVQRAVPVAPPPVPSPPVLTALTQRPANPAQEAPVIAHEPVHATRSRTRSEPAPPATGRQPAGGLPKGVPVHVQRTKNGPEPETRRRQAGRGPEAAGRKQKAGSEHARDATGALDVDELARRLLEPVSRLLRAELRQGRARFGQAHDRRR